MEVQTSACERRPRNDDTKDSNGHAVPVNVSWMEITKTAADGLWLTGSEARREGREKNVDRHARVYLSREELCRLYEKVVQFQLCDIPGDDELKKAKKLLDKAIERRCGRDSRVRRKRTS